MKILSIGNSFSNDAHRYLNKISEAAGNPIKTVNLYIGGCSLKTHYINMLENARNYELQLNGEDSRIFVSIKEALKSDSWDYVTLQQVSTDSVNFESYQPYLSALCEYAKRYAPGAKIIIHQTWAYSEDVVKKSGVAENSKKMLLALKRAYALAAEAIDADGIIPCGEAIAALIENGISSPYRDGYHLSLGEGRLLAALLWYCYFTNENPYSVPIVPLDVEVSPENADTVRKTVAEILSAK